MAEKKTWLEHQLGQVSVRDIEKVHLPSARALFSEVSSNTENPYSPGDKGSEDPRFLSSSTKFDKGIHADDPRITHLRQKGMYLIPGGKHGTKNACCDNGNCTGPCISETGRLPQFAATSLARNTMLEKHPVESLALIADEAHSFFATAIRKGYLPSLRLDGTSELHVDHTDAGDWIYGGPGGMYQKKRDSGLYKGQPMAVGSEYGKRYAMRARGARTPESRQPNVRRVHSWSESLTDERLSEIQSHLEDIAVPATNYGTSTSPKAIPSHVAVNVKKEDGTGRTNVVMPAADYDTHDVIWAREKLPVAGMLRAKGQSFGHQLTEKEQKQASKFLLRHEPAGEHPAPEFAVSGMEHGPVEASGLSSPIRRSRHTNLEQFGA